MALGTERPYSTFCLDDHESAERLRDEWAALFEEAAPRHPFLHPDWYLNWWKAFSRPEWAMRLWGVREGGVLRAVAPMYVSAERRWGGRDRVLRFWADPSSNRAGPLSAPDGSRGTLAALARAIEASGGWDVAVLEYLDLADPVSGAFHDGFVRAGCKVGVSEGYASPMLHLPNDPDDVDARLGSSFRQSLRRKLKATREQDARVVVREGADGMGPVFGLSKLTWQHEAGTGLESTSAFARFHRGIFQRPWLRERVRVALLEIQTVPIAFELNLQMDRTLYNLKVGYDPQHGALSPGIVLRHETIRAAIADGFEAFDFLGEAEAYKNHWADSVTRHGTSMVFPPTLRGAACHFVLFRVKPFLRRVPGVRRLARALRSVVPGAA